MSAAREPVLELRQVTKVYAGTVVALRAVDLAVQTGERACLLGPNGAGKTTVVRLLEGALRPTSGAVHLTGMRSDHPYYTVARRCVGIVPQAPGMYDDLLLREYLELVRRLYRCSDASETVEALGLGPYLGRPLAALSGGLQRRAVLAAALLPKPAVLILDEPTVGLDPLAARDMRQTLRQAMAGRTVLLCTHNLAEAEALCDSVIILRAGEVMLHESIDRLRARLAPRLRLAANQGRAPLAHALRDLGHLPVQGDAATDVPPLEVELTLAEPEQSVPQLLRALLARGLDIHEAHVMRPTLEELFFHVLEASLPAKSGGQVVPDALGTPQTRESAPSYSRAGGPQRCLEST